MGENGTASPLKLAPKAGLLGWHRQSALAPFLETDDILEIGDDVSSVADHVHQVVLAAYRLQDVVDYRVALQTWFEAVRTGGHLILVVPHAFLYERQLELPTPLNPGQRRLYTPAMLMEQVEEALAPNSYRLRLLSDEDKGYDYETPIADVPSGHSDVLLVLQRIEPPMWRLDVSHDVVANAPDYAFEPSRTRVEVAERRDLAKVLILKLDHLGDFIMGLPALERARSVFADAEITLVVGSWNAQVARDMMLADHVVEFDAFPRNSTEEIVDVPGRAAIFRATITGKYDLAIDLRTDSDTRFLLKSVNAGLKAGIGTRTQFPFLDIFLPLDANRNEPEAAREYKFNNHDFISQGPVVRNNYRSCSFAETAERGWAIIWGPHHRLRPGHYIFEPYIELAKGSEGMLMLDIGLDTERVAYVTIPPVDKVRLSFVVEKPNTSFEFRIFTVDDMPSIDFSFFGGRLIRAGAASVLHQAEYLFLLIDLVAIRLSRTGALTDVSGP